jgi:DNA-binding GntR family transcriptional regulator
VQKAGKPDVWEIDRMPTHAELASRVATHREAVTRVLHKLEVDGTIRRHGKRLVLSDIVGLRQRVLEEKE